MIKWYVFTGPGCAYCPQVKALLQDRGIDYEEVVIDSREKFLFMQQYAPGVRSVPTVVHGSDVLIGYDAVRDYFTPHDSEL